MGLPAGSWTPSAAFGIPQSTSSSWILDAQCSLWDSTVHLFQLDLGRPVQPLGFHSPPLPAGSWTSRAAFGIPQSTSSSWILDVQSSLWDSTVHLFQLDLGHPVQPLGFHRLPK